MFLIPALVDAAEKGIMRRHHKALVADFDGSLESFESEEQRWHLWEKAETPVENNSYQIAFEMDGQLMCWQRETDGCRQFSGDCEVMYCEPKYCDCMIVQIKRCGDHMDLFTEADWAALEAASAESRHVSASPRARCTARYSVVVVVVTVVVVTVVVVVVVTCKSWTRPWLWSWTSNSTAHPWG